MGRAILGFLLAALLGACDATLANRATVFPPVTGKFDLKWTVDVAGTDFVVVQVDGSEVGRAAASSNVFMVQLDSRKFTNGIHRLHLEAHSNAGALLEVLDNAVFISN
jgi:hypothetical protein